MTRFNVGDKVKLLRQDGVIESFFEYPDKIKTVVRGGEGLVLVYCEEEKVSQDINVNDLEKVEQRAMADQNKNNLQSHIDDVMDWFDFERVNKAMLALNWEWVSAEEGISSQPELRQQVRRLMKYCYERGIRDGDFTAISGDFIVSYDKGADKFDVKFVLSRWVTDLSDEAPF